MNTGGPRNYLAMKRWTSIADLCAKNAAPHPVALVGAPVKLGSVTPGACDLAPGVIRAAMKRTGVYDVETGREISTAINDVGDLDVARCTPADCFEPVRNGVRALTDDHGLTIMLGGNNAITRPGVHGLGDLANVGLVTLDAHFDMRDTSDGLGNGNPVQALLDDGMAGANIAQIGLAPFANARYMHDAARAAGNTLYTMADVRRRGVSEILAEALDTLSRRCERIYVDFDIDVIERGLAPGAPGARPGGMSTVEFFDAARIAGAHKKVAAVDLAEFDPSLDVSDITALIGARWVAELLAGFETRNG